MAKVLTTGSSVTCAMQGSVAVLQSTAKLKVADKPVLRESDISKWTISGCNQMKGQTKDPCTKIGTVSKGSAQKLTCDGSAVLLDDFKATAPAPGTPHSQSASGGQAKLTAS
jgi:hypothetical protein